MFMIIRYYLDKTIWRINEDSNWWVTNEVTYKTLYKENTNVVTVNNSIFYHIVSKSQEWTWFNLPYYDILFTAILTGKLIQHLWYIKSNVFLNRNKWISEIILILFRKEIITNYIYYSAKYTICSKVDAGWKNYKIFVIKKMKNWVSKII